MDWQTADEELHELEGHLPVSRCSSVVALQLAGGPMAQVRNRGRRVRRMLGDVYDPFSPWRVLSMQCYPDWKSSVDSHDSTKHYVNGPEAFLVTLRAEYRDAQKRLKEVYNRISNLVRSPVSVTLHLLCKSSCPHSHFPDFARDGEHVRIESFFIPVHYLEMP